MDAPPGSVVAVIGAPGTGKSRAVKAAAAAGAWPRRVVYEPHARRDRIEEARGRKLYPWPGSLVSIRDLMRRPDLLDSDPLALVVDPAGLDAVSMGRDFGTLARLAWHTGDLTIIAEEAAIYARQALEAATLISTGGRHAGLRLIAISQSWTRIPLDVRRCVSDVIAFAQSEPRDVDELGRKCGRDFAERVRRLSSGAIPCTWRQGDAG